MTRFKKELIKRGVMLEETLPYMPYDEIEAIVVDTSKCEVAYYDNRIGWYSNFYDRSMTIYKQVFEDDELNDILTLSMKRR